MWFDGIRKDNTLYVATVSRGKDSTAMLRAIQIMGWPLDAIISMDIWFDDETPAELPELVAFKDEWDKKCFEHFGIEVTRVCALTDLENKRNHECEKYKDKYKLTYCDIFYKHVPIEIERERERRFTKGRNFKADIGTLGFPHAKNRWCTGYLKQFSKTKFLTKPSGTKGKRINIVQYIGIAKDEPKRISCHINKKKYSHAIGSNRMG